MSFPKTSPYGITKKGADMMGLYKHRRIPKHDDDFEMTLSLKYHNRPDLLSYDLYGTPEFWWIFCVRNPNVVRDSIWDFKTGMKIWVPSDEHLKRVIG